MDIKRDYFAENMIALDFFNSLVGQHLGTGTMRSVYRWLANDKMVVKFEHESKKFANVSEHDLWNEVRGLPQLAKWFAPVYDISPCGNVLWQKFIPDIPIDKLPKRIPECFCDLKAENWGIWRGQPVCRDYGNHAAFVHGLSTRMAPAKWRHV